MVVSKSFKGPWHLAPILDKKNFNTIAIGLAKKIKAFKTKTKFDSIVFCGLSGSVISGALAMKLNIPIIAIRKKSDAHFGYSPVIGNIKTCKKYIIVDDLVDSGATVKHIVKTIKEDYYSNKSIACVGVFLYGTTEEFFRPTIEIDGKVIPMFRLNIALRTGW